MRCVKSAPQKGAPVPIVALIIVLILIAGLLAFLSIILIMSRKRQTIDIVVDFTESLKKLEDAANHYADVSRVVTMLAQLKEMDQDALALLESYPATVRAAALLHRINCLGADIQQAQEELSQVNQHTGDYMHWMEYYLQKRREQLRAHINQLTIQLEDAVNVSKQGTTSTL